MSHYRSLPDEAAIGVQKKINKAILEWLFNKYRALRGEQINDDAASLIEKVGSRLTEFTDDNALSRILSKDSDYSMNWRQFIYLEPIRDNGVHLPVIAFEHDYSIHSSHPELRLQLAIFSSPREDWDADGGYETDPSAMGFRYETCEGIDSGIHSYCHVQPFRKFRNAPEEDRFTLAIPDFGADSTPAFPLDATNTTELLLAMLLSLYGRKRVCGEILKEVLQDVDLTKQEKMEAFMGMREIIRPHPPKIEMSGGGRTPFTKFVIEVQKDIFGDLPSNYEYIFRHHQTDRVTYPNTDGRGTSSAWRKIPAQAGRSSIEVSFTAPIVGSGRYELYVKAIGRDNLASISRIERTLE